MNRRLHNPAHQLRRGYRVWSALITSVLLVAFWAFVFSLEASASPVLIVLATLALVLIPDVIALRLQQAADRRRI
jgi:hypothetical protein